MFRDGRLVREMAGDRMARLFALAEIRAKAQDPESKDLSRRYIKLARKISSHYKVKIPGQVRDKVCKNCNNVLLPGINCYVRIASSGYRVYTCECGAKKRVHHR